MIAARISNALIASTFACSPEFDQAEECCSTPVCGQARFSPQGRDRQLKIQQISSSACPWAWICRAAFQLSRMRVRVVRTAGGRAAGADAYAISPRFDVATRPHAAPGALRIALGGVVFP